MSEATLQSALAELSIEAATCLRDLGRAPELVEQLERVRRDVYAGAIVDPGEVGGLIVRAGEAIQAAVE